MVILIDVLLKRTEHKKKVFNVLYVDRVFCDMSRLKENWFVCKDIPARSNTPTSMGDLKSTSFVSLRPSGSIGTQCVALKAQVNCMIMVIAAISNISLNWISKRNVAQRSGNSRIALVDLHRTVEVRQFFLQELQVRVDVTEFQRDGFF